MTLTVMTLMAYVGGAPSSGSKTMLIIAAVLFILAALGLGFGRERYVWAGGLIPAGLFFVTLAFLVS